MASVTCASVTQQQAKFGVSVTKCDQQQNHVGDWALQSGMLTAGRLQQENAGSPEPLTLKVSTHEKHLRDEDAESAERARNYVKPAKAVTNIPRCGRKLVDIT